HKENVPWENVKELYQSVDALPHGPDWSHKNLHISTPEGAETHDVWKRCPVAGTEELIGNRRFDKRIHYRPEQHHQITPDGQKVHVYSDMRTGKWWWGMQDALGPNTTIAPGIVMTDATMVTLFTGKKVWPVYMTIANIDKDVRRQPSERAVILIWYLPVPDLSWISNKDERSQTRWELYHAGTSEILAPLKQASVHGVEMSGQREDTYQIGDTPGTAIQTLRTLYDSAKLGIAPGVAVLGETSACDRPFENRTQPITPDPPRDV
ncbi:hypothetical protein FRC07_014017, partial [Ceratobasidium sp. 392]